jgi:hypothetical protein
MHAMLVMMDDMIFKKEGGQSEPQSKEKFPAQQHVTRLLGTPHPLFSNFSLRQFLVNCASTSA